MKAGVTMRPMKVEKASVHSGVTASPTPRRIEVASRKMKNSRHRDHHDAGVVRRRRSMMSAGVRSAIISGRGEDAAEDAR